MAVLVLLALILSFTGSSDADWCVCRSDASEKAIQITLDYSCGAGADCTPIHNHGDCYDPNTVLDHCSYAANSYYQRMQASGATCDFKGTATLTNTDPSHGSCSFPSSASAAESSGSSSGDGNETGFPSTTGSLSPPSIFGLGPTGSGTFSDASDGGLPTMELARKYTPYMALLLSALFFLRF